MAAITHPEPTEEQLRAVWAQRRRDNWPPTYEETMQDPVLSRIVRMTALHPPGSATPPRGASAASMHTPGARSNWRPAPAPPIFDRKRAAAGDRDDD